MQRKGALMVAVPTGLLGPLSGTVPHPQPRAPARGVVQQIFIQRHFPGRSPAAPPGQPGWGPAHTPGHVRGHGRAPWDVPAEK